MHMVVRVIEQKSGACVMEDRGLFASTLSIELGCGVRERRGSTHTLCGIAFCLFAYVAVGCLYTTRRSQI